MFVSGKVFKIGVIAERAAFAFFMELVVFGPHDKVRSNITPKYFTSFCHGRLAPWNITVGFLFSVMVKSMAWLLLGFTEIPQSLAQLEYRSRPSCKYFTSCVKFMNFANIVGSSSYRASSPLGTFGMS